MDEETQNQLIANGTLCSICKCSSEEFRAAHDAYQADNSNHSEWTPPGHPVTCIECAQNEVNMRGGPTH